MNDKPLPSAATTYRISVPKASIAPRGAALTGALVPTGDGTFTFRGYQLTGVGLAGGEGSSEQDWLELGGVLRALEGSLQWLIGDWVAAGELRWGKTYEEICELTGYEYGTVRNYAYIARSVNLSLRNDKLSHAHHALVAPIDDPDLQRQWLQYAVEHRLSVAKLRAEMRAADEEAQRQISQMAGGGDSPTAGDGGLWAENGSELPAITSNIIESSSKVVQLNLWNEVDWSGWRKANQRLANASRGKLNMTREQLWKEIEAQERVLAQLKRIARGE